MSLKMINPSSQICHIGRRTGKFHLDETISLLWGESFVISVGSLVFRGRLFNVVVKPGNRQRAPNESA
jgi:hypothetical protein